MTYTPLPPFDIRSFIDYLQPSSKKGKFICPACGEDNFSISAKVNAAGVPHFTCWNDDTEAHKREIKEALRPWTEVLAERQPSQNNLFPRRPRTQSTPKPTPLPLEGMTLARLTEPATDSPQPFKRPDSKHGEVLVWRFPYSDRQWIERVQWADSTKAKGYDKNYYPYHLAIEGEKIPVKQGRKTIGFRPAKPDEIICGTGSEAWTAYRLEEAIAAAQTSGSNAILIVEGEPCVEVSRGLGLAATTLLGSGWSKTAISALMEKIHTAKLGVVMIPDHDKTGYGKAQKIATACAVIGVPYLQIDPTALDSEIEEHGDIANIVANLGSDEYQRRLAAEIQRQLELRRQLDPGSFDPPNGGGGDGGDGGDGSDDDFSGNDWKAPVSWKGELGFWVNDKTTQEPVFHPCCNFDFQVIRELTSEDGGGIEITLKRSFDSVEKSIFIESMAYTNTEKFVDAVKKALGAGVVCTLRKSDLNALIHTRLRDYHRRGGKTYRLAERRGRQADGTWVFENCQFKPDGTRTHTEESGWVYTEVFPNCEDVIPSPVIAPYDAGVLRRYLEVKRRAFGRNFEPSVLLDGWVVAGLFDTQIVEKERSFPLINPYGDPGGFKSFAAESSLSLVGFSKAETMLSKVSESALFEWLKRLGSIPVILDDPKREFNGIDIEEVAKRAFNRFARVVRGNRQEPRGGLAITSNHLIGEKNSATRSRLIPLFFPVLTEESYEKAAFSELLQIRESVSGCFPDLLKLGYNPQAIKTLEEEFRHHLPAAHARTAKSLAIATHYAMEVIRLAELESDIDIKQWVMDSLCPLCNESQAGLSSVADFAEYFGVLESRSLVGEWCKILVQTEKYGTCMALHLPTVWKEFDREFNPSYNRSVLEQVLIERGAIKNQVAKFWSDRDQTLAYKRQVVVAGANGEPPKEPGKVARKCLLIPEEIWDTLFKGYSVPKPMPPTPPPDPHSSSYPPVTLSYPEQVTGSTVDTVSNTTVQDNTCYPVTYKKEDSEWIDSNLHVNASDSTQLNSESLEMKVTEVTEGVEMSQTLATPSEPVVTDAESLSVTEGSQEVTDSRTTDLLSSEQLAQALQSMEAIKSMRVFEWFKTRYEQLPEAQQRQIWQEARPELRQKYEHWLNAFLSVPDVVWEAREALLRISDSEGMKEIRARFDRDTLNQAYQLVHPEVKKRLKQWIKMTDSL